MESYPTDESVVRREDMSGAMTKFHLGDNRVLHRFTRAEDEHAHNHPWAFTSHVLSGGYVERIYTFISDGGYTFQDIRRLPGTSHRIAANTVHRLIGLIEGECWTLIQAEAWEQKSGFFDFSGTVIRYRDWDGDWQPFTV